MTKIMTFFIFAVIADIWTAGCGTTTRLPPVGTAPAPAEPPTQQTNGARRRIPISSGDAQQVANYISGKPLTILSNGQASACFIDFIACSGKYKNASGAVKSAVAGDACDFNIINGKISLTLWDSKETLLYEFLITAPTSYFPPPTVIQDANGKITLNQLCTL
jgi:hypothetical protein